VGLKAANPGLNISFTLPVLPTGLTADGINVLASAKHDGLNVDLVNIMTMDYGASVDNGGAMGVDAINATIATEKQLASLGLSSKIGITSMISVNDIASEVFTLADAQTLVNYAQLDANVARLSMWSVARDNGNSVPTLRPTAAASPSSPRLRRDLPSVRSHGVSCAPLRWNRAPQTGSLPSPLWGGSARSAGVGVVVVERASRHNDDLHPQRLPTRGRGSHRVRGAVMHLGTNENDLAPS